MSACVYCGSQGSGVRRVRTYRIDGEDVRLCAPNSDRRCYWKFKNMDAMDRDRLIGPKSSSRYRQTLSKAAESARVDSILRATINRGPLIRGTPEWEERERARAAAGCSCLSFGEVD